MTSAAKILSPGSWPRPADSYTPDPVAGSDAAAAHWLPVSEVLGGRRRLAFDHGQILRDGLERAKAKLEYAPLATALCPPEFTVAQLRHVYEAVWQEQLDPRNFHRKVTRTPGFLVDTGRSVNAGPGRPAVTAATRNCP